MANVTAAADRLRERIEQMERDMTQLVIDLREGADRLRGDLDGLQAGTDALSAARGAAPSAPALPEPRAVAPAPEPRRATRGAGRRARVRPLRPSRPAAPAPKNGDSAAARIVALDMALSGTSREDTDRYLAENYDLPDRAALLDEVYAARRRVRSTYARPSNRSALPWAMRSRSSGLSGAVSSRRRPSSLGA